MKRSREDTAETRRRIVAVAAREFCRNGVAATGLADVMAAAGLTQGGFYRHFASKDQVLEESLDIASQTLIHRIEPAAKESSGKSALNAALASYLSTDHRDNAAGGCPFVALGSELARGSERVRDAATTGVRAVLDTIAGEVEGVSRATAKRRALVILSTLVGALTLARMVDDQQLSDAFLEQAFKALTQDTQSSA
jgi:TetR/AcrR family transcriptional repressor of nem operon